MFVGRLPLGVPVRMMCLRGVFCVGVNSLFCSSPLSRVRTVLFDLPVNSSAFLVPIFLFLAASSFMSYTIATSSDVQFILSGVRTLRAGNFGGRAGGEFLLGETRGGGSGSIGGRLLNLHPNPYSPRHALTQLFICVSVSSDSLLLGTWVILFLQDLKQ